MLFGPVGFAPVADDGDPAAAGGSYSIIADPGSYTLTGTVTGLRAQRSMVAAPGSYSLTGTAALLKAGRKIVAAPGAYALTGTPVGLVRSSSTLTDNFDDNSRDTAKWNLGAPYQNYSSTGATISEVNGQVEAGIAAATQAETAFVSVNDYTLDTIFVRATPGVMQSPHRVHLTHGTDFNNRYSIFIGGAGTLNFARLIAGVATLVANTAYSAANHAWLRLRHSAGTIYVDTAPSTAGNPPTSGEWVNRFSEAKHASFSLVGKSSFGVASVDTSAGSSFTTTFDGFNTARNAVGYSMAADPGSYALTGTPAGLRADRRVVAVPGSYALTGTAAGTRAQRRMVAAVGSYTLTGTAALLNVGRKIVATPGSYALTGTAAGLVHAQRLVAAPGSYALTGTPTGLRAGRRLAAVVGSYLLTGTAVTLTQGAAPTPGYTMTAAVGSYTLTGSAAGLRAQRTMPVASGSYGITGPPVNLLAGRKMVAVPGAYALTGTPAGLSHGWRMVATPGAYALTGTAVTFPGVLKKISPRVGYYWLTGTELAYVAPVLPARKERVVFNVNEPEVIRVQKLQTVADQVVPAAVDVYSMAELAAITKAMGLEAHCHDAPGGYVPVFCDGVNWRSVVTRAVVI